VVAKLDDYDGVSQVSTDFRPGKNEIRFELKPEGRALGITVSDLARQVFAGFFGEEAMRLQRGRDDIRVRIRYPLSGRDNLAELAKVRIRTPQGHEVPLESVATASYGPGYASITRTDGMRRVAVSAEVDNVRANAEEVVADLEAGFVPDLMRKFPGVNVSQQGAKADSAESLQSLYIGFPLALLGIFVIIATVFRSYAQPFIIMLTVPFGIIGAVLGHLVMGEFVTMMSLFGIVALAGVVVNDAIVLIECVNTFLSKGMPFFEALPRAGARRFRAIFLTTASTVGGLAPMIIETDFQARFLVPMAISIAAGVLFATLLTLVLIPCLLAILNDLRRLWVYARTGVYPDPNSVEPASTRLVDDLNGPEAEDEYLGAPGADAMNLNET
jgi:multidrug efflux pump subunit AcrB